MDGQAIVALAGAFITALIWLIRLEGRVNTQQALIDGVKEDVRYIRRRIDQALNGHDDDK